MKGLLGCGAVLALIAVVVVMWAVGVHNELVGLDENVNTAWAQVENAYQRRADLIPNLVSTVEGAADFERETLTEVVEARSRATQVQITPDDLNDPAALARFQQAQDGISSALSRLLVVIERTLGPFEKPRDRAVRTFGRLGMHRTKHRNGVLVFVVMKKRCFEIVADEGIDAKVDHDVWDEIAEVMAERIDHDGFAEGMATGIRKIGALLAEHYPRGEDDTNELPNRPSVG